MLQGFKGASVYSPGGSRLDFKAASCRAWAVDRRLFDRALALEALREVAELRLCSPVRRIKREGESSFGSSEGSAEIEALVVVSAEGVRARLARQVGVPPQKVLPGAQEALSGDDPGVEVHLRGPGLRLGRSRDTGKDCQVQDRG
jgi:flavin-dependent dehydrogenase